MMPRTATILVSLSLLACTEPSGKDIDGAADALPDVPDADAMEAVDAPDATEAPTDPEPDDGFVDTIGMVCASADECQNGLFCDGEERCPYGFCTAGSLPDCSDGVNCTLDTCNEETDSCDHEVDDSACDDSNPCTTDTCEVSTDTCVNAPIDCADTVNCTLDTCDTTTGDCVHTVADEACDDSDACTIDTCTVSTDTCVNTLIDGDGDLHPPESCGGDDCDDTVATIYTGAPEVCDDGIDQDCDGSDERPGSCDCPVSVTLGSVVNGDTTGMPATTAGSCDIFGMSGGEVVHSLVLTASTAVSLEHYSDVTLGMLFVRGSTCTGTEEACEDYTTGITTTLAAGTHYIFFDDVIAGIYGTFTLVVREATTPTAVTGNDSCSSAHAITADGSWSGSNSGLTNDGSGTCATATTGLDAWFTFTTTASTNVHIDTFGSDYDTLLFIREGTCTGTEAGCDEDAGFRTESALDLTLPAGTYLLAVDGSDVTDTGTYQLNVMGL